MDYSNSGRVKLSDFYSAAMDGEWRFSESKEYLRQLGALDESSRWHGPRVIITNYMQAASNCIVSAPHYRVCCTNECENILIELENNANSPLAEPGLILAVLANITITIDDEQIIISASMKRQLHEIAMSSPGSRVPLHGRLFAQWLHYVFPRECPFPHKSGQTVALSPIEYGEKYAASEEEMTATTNQQITTTTLQAEGDSDDWIEQWSHEEELLSDLTHLHAPWDSKTSTRCGLLCFGVILMFVGVVNAFNRDNYRRFRDCFCSDLLPISNQKSHCV